MAQQQQRYKVIERIASGGMAEVFRAESAGLEGFKKTVAIKRVLPHLSEKKQFMGMFLDEARLSAHLSHSNCVQVFDIGVGDNTYFIVMEFVDGADLKGVIEHHRKLGQRVPIEEACLICVRICEGLTYAHELADSRGRSLNIVHRDMSPPNVLITRHGEVKIVDFGLAKANSQLEHSEPGIIKGKFSYLSPEAAHGQPVDARTDIFAVGIILWELLANRRLFLGESDIETVTMVQQARVPSLRQFNPAVSSGLETVVMKALAGDPRQRYQRARDLGRDLNKIMFHLGREVSSFDIAQLVLPIWRERREKKAQKQEVRGSFIGSLIDEALFEFTSLDGEGSGDRRSHASTVGAAPLSLSTFEDVQSLTEDLGALAQRWPSTSGPKSLEVGNLAALEDDPAFAQAPSRSGKRPSARPVSPPVETETETARPPPDLLTEERSEAELAASFAPPWRRRGRLISLGLGLLAIGGAVGAYLLSR